MFAVGEARSKLLDEVECSRLPSPNGRREQGRAGFLRQYGFAEGKEVLLKGRCS